MQFAVDADGERVLPSPKAKAMCPGCGAPVIAKCGEIVMWHWSHLTKDCDPWYEPESVWHRQWKERFPESWREAVIGSHRADIKTPHGVVEFQASSISSTEVQERENFYGKMIWVVKADTFDLDAQLSPKAQSFLDKSLGFREGYGNLFDLLGENLHQQAQSQEAREKLRVAAASTLKEKWDRSWLQDPMYRWRWPRTTWGFAKKKIYLDLGDEDELFGVTWMSPDCKRIKGVPLKKEKFISKLLA